MQRTVSAITARQRLGELLEGVYYRGDEVIIERAGKPMGVVIPMERYRQIEASRERLWNMFEEIREQNRGVDPDEIEQMAIEEVEAVREEQRRAARAEQASGHP